jgi:hypothetical protein
MGPILDRRGFLVATGVSIMAKSLPKSSSVRAQQTAQSPTKLSPELANVKACVFDVFGTVVDWRTSVIADATRRGKAKSLHVNWVEFTDRWRMWVRTSDEQSAKGRDSVDQTRRLAAHDSGGLAQAIQNPGAE